LTMKRHCGARCPMVDLLFICMLLGSCGYAFLAGGKEGRWISTMLVFAAFGSLPASWIDYAWRQTQVPVLLLDTVLLVALVSVALRSRRGWPLWMAGFHLISVATHVATLIAPGLRPITYFAMQAFWSLPVLMVMVGGIMLDRRASPYEAGHCTAS